MITDLRQLQSETGEVFMEETSELARAEVQKLLEIQCSYMRFYTYVLQKMCTHLYYVVISYVYVQIFSKCNLADG